MSAAPEPCLIASKSTSRDSGITLAPGLCDAVQVWCGRTHLFMKAQKESLFSTCPSNYVRLSGPAENVENTERSTARPVSTRPGVSYPKHVYLVQSPAVHSEVLVSQRQTFSATGGCYCRRTTPRPILQTGETALHFMDDLVVLVVLLGMTRARDMSILIIGSQPAATKLLRATC